MSVRLHSTTSKKKRSLHAEQGLLGGRHLGDEALVDLADDLEIAAVAQLLDESDHRRVGAFGVALAAQRARHCLSPPLRSASSAAMRASYSAATLAR